MCKRGLAQGCSVQLHADHDGPKVCAIQVGLPWPLLSPKRHYLQAIMSIDGALQVLQVGLYSTYSVGWPIAGRPASPAREKRECRLGEEQQAIQRIFSPLYSTVGQLSLQQLSHFIAAYACTCSVQVAGLLERLFLYSPTPKACVRSWSGGQSHHIVGSDSKSVLVFMCTVCAIYTGRS